MTVQRHAAGAVFSSVASYAKEPPRRSPPQMDVFTLLLPARGEQPLTTALLVRHEPQERVQRLPSSCPSIAQKRAQAQQASAAESR